MFDAAFVHRTPSLIGEVGQWSVFWSTVLTESLPHFSRGRPGVSVARGQKLLLTPAVSSAMCRMWVVFKGDEGLAFDTKRRRLPRSAELRFQWGE